MKSCQITRREFVMSVGSLALGAHASSASEQKSSKPNIIYIMADDLGYGDLGCYGQKLIHTPHIDRLADEGIRFTQCYSGSTVCAPARSCLMTGQHTGHTRIRGNRAYTGGNEDGRFPLHPEDVTIAETLKEAGYATGIVGKWGLGDPGQTGVPNRQGFDFWFGYLNQKNAHEYYPPFLWRNEEKCVLEANRNAPKTDYSHDLFTKEALAFIRRNGDRPFFLYLPYTIPHGKYQIPSDAPYSDRDWPQEQKNFAAMVTRLDRDVGKIMVLLSQLGLDRNTAVFFCSDNGATRAQIQWGRFGSAGPFRGQKGTLYEGGIRVPMIVRWPGRVRSGQVSDQVWAFWDFLPTAAEIAGAKVPPGIDGISMLPAILGEKQKKHEYLYWEFGVLDKFSQGVRRGDWKAIRTAQTDTVELYNLKADLGEKHDASLRHPDIVKEVLSIMEAAHVETPHYPSLRGKR